MRKGPSTKTPSRTTATASALAARVNLNALRGILDVLDRFGVAAGPVLQAASLTLADFEDPERSATFERLDRLFAIAVKQTGCGHFGLLVGTTINLQSFGIAGRLARNAPTVVAALWDLTRYFVLHDSGGTINVAVRDGAATVTYGIHTTGFHNADQVYDLAVAALLNVMRQLCGPGMHPDAVLLPRSRPRDIRAYREALGAPLRFDSMQAGLALPVRWLDRPIADADALLHRLIEDRATAVMAQLDPLLHNEVRRVLRGVLMAGDCSRAEVARRLGLHPRTLVRRLQQSGTTFQALLDDTRSQIAKQLLHDTGSPVSRIAASLGYRDPTVFTRAFRRWTGLTPRQFRAALPDKW